MRLALVRDLQRTHGNAHVARLLVQRASPVIGTAAEQQRFEDIRKIMEASPTGKEATAVLDTHKVKVDFDVGTGSFYEPTTNTITLDSAESDASAALTLVHELNHARYEKEGLTADVMKLGRDDYVKQSIDEEVEGAVKSIEAKMELQGAQLRTGNPPMWIDVANASAPQDDVYLVAYRQAIDAAKAKDPATPEPDLEKLGREAGRARVLKGFMDGEVISSDSHKPYPILYGEYWDQAHPAPGAP
jgi:hypothetical protein